MRIENDGITLWVASVDGPEVTVAVQPIDADNRVEILLQRRGQRAVEPVPARWLWNDDIDHIQYFRVALSAPSPGDRYTVLCRCAGRQAPKPAEEELVWTTFEPESTASRGESTLALYLDQGASIALQPLAKPTVDFTISLWLRPTRAGIIFSNKSVCGGDSRYAGMKLQLDNSGSLGFAVDDSLGFYSLDTGNTLLWDGNWHLISVVRKGASIRIFLDGIPLLTRPGGSNPVRNIAGSGRVLLGATYGTIRNDCFGKAIDSAGGFFNYVRWWNTALSDEDLEKVPPPIPPQEHLAAQWDFTKDLINQVNGQSASVFSGGTYGLRPGSNPFINS